MISKDSLVKGTDFKGNAIKGTVEHIIGLANVALIKIGEDRLDTTEAYISDLEEIII